MDYAPRFDMGVTIGRFGHVQLGHNSLFDMSMMLFMYPELRAELMSVPVYKEIYNIVRRGEMDLDSFMKVYKQYEEADWQKKLAELQK